jgi:hypothetical protein
MNISTKIGSKWPNGFRGDHKKNGRGSNYHEWGSIYQKRNKRPKGVKMGDLFFSENTGNQN